TEPLAKILEARIGCVAKEVAHLVVRLALGRLRLEVSLASEDLAHDVDIPGASDASRPGLDRIERGIAKKLRSDAADDGERLGHPMRSNRHLDGSRESAGCVHDPQTIPNGVEKLRESFERRVVPENRIVDVRDEKVRWAHDSREELAN